MQNKSYSIFPINKALEEVNSFILPIFPQLAKQIDPQLTVYLQVLRADLTCYIEYPYLDEYYLDSYSQHYSKTYLNYDRYTARILFFQHDITQQIESNSDNHVLKENYLGFITIRPTENNIIGRSYLSPMALKSNNFFCALATFETELNGISLKVNCFPHTAVDSNLYTCGEDVVWALLEYYGTKFSSYKNLQPIEIGQQLKSQSSFDHFPSIGVTREEIAYLLKSNGFRPKVYDINTFGERALRRIIDTYVNSGIPILSAMSNDQIHHINIIIGRKALKSGCLSFKKGGTNFRNGLSKYEIKDTSLIEKNYIFIDDNFPPYQNASFDNPASYYFSEQWNKNRIKTLIIPLPKEITLDSEDSYRFVVTFHKEFYDYLPIEDVIIKPQLISSEKFKSHISNQINLSISTKKMLLSFVYPKYVWVFEITNLNLINENKSLGLMIIDAGSLSIRNFRPLVFYILNNEILFRENNQLSKINLKESLNYKNYSP